MKRFLPILLLTGFSSPVMADITHKLSSSVQLQVNAAATQVERIGSSWSVSGNGVDTTDGTTVNTVSAATITLTTLFVVVMKMMMSEEFDS